LKVAAHEVFGRQEFLDSRRTNYEEPWDIKSRKATVQISRVIGKQKHLVKKLVLGKGKRRKSSMLQRQASSEEAV
jgi:hypothetical protein